jgi:hypothetical protein
MGSGECAEVRASPGRLSRRAVWWAAARAGAGRLAVAAPAAMVAIAVWRAVVKDRSRAATGWPVRGPLDNGAATVAAVRVRAWTSAVAVIQAACSARISTGEWERSIAPVPAPAPCRVDFGLAQGGLGPVPAPPVGRREQVRGVSLVVVQVGEQGRQNSSGVVIPARVTWYSITLTVRVTPPPDMVAR